MKNPFLELSSYMVLFPIKIKANVDLNQWMGQVQFLPLIYSKINLKNLKEGVMEYLPKSNEQQLEWLKKFSEQLTSSGVSLGITPAEIASLNALIADVKDDIRNKRSDNDTELKKQNMFNYLKILVIKLKKHPSYSSSNQGQKLGIEN